MRAFALPPITYGKSEEHLHFPGTMTLTGTTLLATVIEIGESVYRSGFRKLLFANGHGGQPQVLEMAARELRLRHGDFVVVPHGVSRLPNASSKQVSDQEKKLSMHAGHSETALMLALAPDTVHMEHAAANFPPPFPIKLLSPDGRPACAWTARDFGPSGVIGDPTSATPRAGPGDPGHAVRQLGAGADRAVRAALGGARRSRPGAAATRHGFIQRRRTERRCAEPPEARSLHRSVVSPTPFLVSIRTSRGPHHAQPSVSRPASLAAAAAPGLRRHGAGAGPGQVHLHDQLVRAGRARRLLPGGGHRASTRSTAWT